MEIIVAKIGVLGTLITALISFCFYNKTKYSDTITKTRTEWLTRYRIYFSNYLSILNFFIKVKQFIFRFKD